MWRWSTTPEETDQKEVSELYIDKKNMKKLSEVWSTLTDIAYQQDMESHRSELFRSLVVFGEVLRQATADNETAKNRAYEKIKKERETNKNYARGNKNG